MRHKGGKPIAKNTQSRKWLLTINNPLENDFDHDRIISEIQKIKSCVYYCLSDEVGGKEKTHHTHVFLACNSGVRFSTMKNRFPSAHIEMARGTSEQNRDYVFKIGKYEQEKGNTKIVGTEKEFGVMPLERQGSRNDLNDLYDMIKGGLTDYEIFEENPTYILQVDTLEKVRQRIRTQQYKNVIREIETIYIWGKAGTGKTNYIMQEYGYENVFRVTHYSRGCFDSYAGQEVIVFEEFNSSFKIHEMLNYLDIYPLELPCRYMNKVACFNKIFITSNIDLNMQYRDIQRESPETWRAFLRRVHKIMYFEKIGQHHLFNLEEYLKRSYHHGK